MKKLPTTMINTVVGSFLCKRDKGVSRQPSKNTFQGTNTNIDELDI